MNPPRQSPSAGLALLLGAVLLSCGGGDGGGNGPDPDTQVPVVTLGAFSSDTLSGTVTLTATASDDRGVIGVQFLIDGNPLGPEDGASPYSAVWNTIATTDGAHAVGATARDAAGNVGTAPTVSTTIANGPFPGPLRVIIATSGTHPDPDGYSLRLDAGAAQPVSILDTVDYGVVTAGAHVLAISGLKLNCVTPGSRTVQVSGPAVTTAAIDVFCEMDQLLYRAGGVFKRIYESGAPGGDLPSPPIQVFGQARIVWSPDASAVAFDQGVSAGQVSVMNTDGSGFTTVTSEVVGAYWPEWPAPGDLLFFTGHDGVLPRIYSLNLQNQQKLALTPDTIGVNGASVSSDGLQLAFEGQALNDSSFEIYRINLDGTGLVKLTTNGTTDARAAWAPDGARIAFMSARQGIGLTRIFLMNPDGSNQVQLTPDSLMADYPAWSPDGLKLAFVAHNGDYQYGVWLIDRNGGGLQRISTAGGPPLAWRPR